MSEWCAWCGDEAVTGRGHEVCNAALIWDARAGDIVEPEGFLRTPQGTRSITRLPVIDA